MHWYEYQSKNYSGNLHRRITQKVPGFIFMNGFNPEPQ